MRRTLLALPILFALLPLASGGDAKKAELPLLFAEDFDKGAERWQPTDPAGWKIEKLNGDNVFSQFQKASKYKPPHRSPFHIALVKDLRVTDLVLEARVQSTIKDYGHRDACLFFGYQDEGHFYYIHFGKEADDNANQVFIVNGAARKKISTKTTKGTPWTDAWHRLKVVRGADSGSIDVYFDNMKTPAMTATDKTFTWGQVGVGSFDDTTRWDDVTVHGKKHEK